MSQKDSKNASGSVGFTNNSYLSMGDFVKKLPIRVLKWITHDTR